MIAVVLLKQYIYGLNQALKTDAVNQIIKVI